MISEFLSRGTASGNASTKQTAEEEQFLRFHLLPDTTAMLPVQQMTEVLTIPITQVVPIPHMPAWVMGVYNWRGEILWMVDLGQLIGLYPLYQQVTSRSTYTAIVVHSTQQLTDQQPTGNQKIGRKTLGVLVNRVEDIEWCNPNRIQFPPLTAVNSELAAFLRGYWLKSNNEILAVLDSNSIIAQMPQPQVSAAF